MARAFMAKRNYKPMGNGGRSARTRRVLELASTRGLSRDEVVRCLRSGTGITLIRVTRLSVSER